MQNRNRVQLSGKIVNIAAVARSVDENLGLVCFNVYFQQDGATYYTATKQLQFGKISFLDVLFFEEVITIGHR